MFFFECFDLLLHFGDSISQFADNILRSVSYFDYSCRSGRAIGDCVAGCTGGVGDMRKANELRLPGFER